MPGFAYPSPIAPTPGLQTRGACLNPASEAADPHASKAVAANPAPRTRLRPAAPDPGEKGESHRDTKVAQYTK